MSAGAPNGGRSVPHRLGSVVAMATTMIGSGLYDATEVALLCGLAPDQVVRWSTATTHGDDLTMLIGARNKFLR